MKIVFNELSNPIIQQAVQESPEIEAISADSLEGAAKLLADGEADGMISGIDTNSRDIILAARDLIGVKGAVFSSSFLMEKDGQKIVIGDAAVTKHPDEERFYEIILQTYETARLVLDEEPRVVVLSFSTLGSGGKDDTITLSQNVINRVRAEHPEILIDGEMQLDAAIVPEVGEKKAPGSVVAGHANVLICPDLNSGNILYKSMERFGGWTAAGPILQGFKKPISDLSRGSTVEDVALVIKTMEKIIGGQK